MVVLGLAAITPLHMSAAEPSHCIFSLQLNWNQRMLPCPQAEPHPDAAEGAAVAGAAHVEREIHPRPGTQLVGH